MRTSIAVVLLAAATLYAADNDPNTFTDPEKAGLDFQIQGEYLGKTQTGEMLGAQVIARGDGKFEMAGYKGGLPGEGWSRGDGIVRGKGALKGDKATLQVEGKMVEIHGDNMTVLEEGGDKFASLKKVHRKSKSLDAEPPQNATVLFDGESAQQFANGKIVEGNLLLADCESKLQLGDHLLHLEFRTPFKPFATGQARGNSGMYLQSRYEVQVLDSFGLEGKNNECGGIYSIAEPAVNMCYPPLAWQTYDVDFTAAKYDERGKKTANARVTIKHNGVTIHDDVELPNGTPGRKAEGPDPAPLYLQGHGNPVVFRNIWVVAK